MSYDPNRGCSFCTYAFKIIRNALAACIQKEFRLKRRMFRHTGTYDADEEVFDPITERPGTERPDALELAELVECGRARVRTSIGSVYSGRGRWV